MRTWQVVGTSWRAARKGLRVVGFIAAIQLLLNVVALPFVNEAGGASPWVLLLVVAQFFILPLIQGGCLSFANATLIQPPAPFASFSQGARRLYGKLLGFEVLSVGIVLLMALAAALLFGLSLAPAEKAPALSAVLALLAAVPVAVSIYVIFLILTMGPAAVAVDNIGPLAGLKKGLAAGRALLVKVFLVTLALGLTLVPVLLITMIPAFFNPGAAQLGLGWLLTAIILQSAAGALSMMLFALAYVQLYRHHSGRAPAH